MFMRYRGGGIGHTYMRAIEQVYENMSRERIHHKAPKRKDAPMGIDGIDGIDDDEGESEGEDEAPTAATGTSRAAILAGDALNKDDDDSKGDEDNEYLPNSDSYSSGISNSDDLDSDENGGGYESYELGDL